MKSNKPFLPIFAAVGILIIICLMSCRLTGAEESSVDYSARVVDFLTNVGSENEEKIEVVLTRIYDNGGSQVGEMAAAYDSSGLNTQTETYEVSASGARTLKEYYVYTYDTDGDGNPIDRLHKLETFDASGVLKTWSEYGYDADFSDSIAEKTDYKMDGSTAVQTGYQLTTYLKNQAAADKNGKYRTNQYYTIDEDGVTLKLSREYAAWYNNEGEVTSELYHVVRGSGTETVIEDGTDEAFYYITYSRNEQGQVFLRSSYVYDVGDRTLITWEDGPDGSFTATAADDDSFNYNLDFEKIKGQYDLVLSDYDGKGNKTQETMYLYGAIQHVTAYKYNETGGLTEQSRYTKGGAILEQRIVIRYRKEEINGVPYTIRETYTYYFNEDMQPDDSDA